MYELAEGPIWSSREQAWFCVDILTGRLLRFEADVEVNSNSFSEMVSNVIETNTGDFIVSAERSLLLVCSKELKVLNRFDLPVVENMRCNDGSVGPNNRYYFGTMEKTPSGPNGCLYSFDAQGNIETQTSEIGIPNSFIWLNDESVLISDSFRQQTYQVTLLENGKLDWANREVWLDLRGTLGTPDGGTIDEDGNVWLAVWGDASIHQYSPAGKLIDKIELNALQPTSCAFGGSDMDELFITTATEGLSEEIKQKYPDSGEVIVRKVGVKGRELPLFNLEV